MAKSNGLKNSILKLIFQAVAIAGLAEDDTSSPVTSLTVALHTAAPGDGGNQTTSEIAYTGYARISVVRSAVGWTVTGNSVSPAAEIAFGTMTAGAGGTATHASVGTGAGNEMLYSGTLTPNIVVAVGTTPKIATTSTITES